MAAILKKKVASDDRLVKAARKVGGTLGKAEGTAVKARKKVTTGIRDIKKAIDKKVAQGKAAKKQAGKLAKKMAGEARVLVKEAKKTGKRWQKDVKKAARRLSM